MGYKFFKPLTENQKLQKNRTAEEKIKLDSLNAAIADETAARESVDAEIKSSVANLQTALDNEITLRADNIGTLRQAVTDEIAVERQERILQDSNLQSSIESSVANLQSSIQAEQTARISGDSAVIQQLTNKYDPITNNLASSLASEVTLSAKRDETLFADLSASIQAEKTARENSDNTLKTALDNESTLRSQQTTSLSSAIQNEVTARTNATTNLQTNLTSALTKESTLRAKVDDELGDSIRAIYTNINNLVNIDEFSPSTTTKDGKSGIVPAPPKLPNTDTKLLLTSDGWEKMADTAIFIGATPSQNGTLEYTGNAQSPSWLNYDDNKLQIGGTTSGTNATTFTATFTPRGLYCWSDGTRTARNATWSIKPKVVQIPTAAVTSYEYTGENISVGIANPNADLTNKSGTDTAVNAASYTVTFNLKNTSNYIWSDNSTSAKNISWSITPKKLAKPTTSNTAFTYNGNSQSLSISNYDSVYMSKSGTDTAIAAANYSVTFALKNTTNLRWSDNTSENVVINWSIAVLKLAKPTAAVTEFEYNGSTKTLSISNFDSNFMTESGTKSQVNAGSYNSIYTLKDKVNSKWQDDSTNDVNISWKINRMKLSAAQSTFSQSGTLTYTGNLQSVTITNYNSNYHELSSTTSETAAGSYVAKVAPKSNYAFSDGSTTAKSVNWTIGKKTFNKPVASAVEFEYTGNTITLSVSNYDSVYMSKSGSDTAIAEGDYSVTYTLKDTANYQWQDSSNSSVVINWKIKTNKIVKPTITAGATQEYTGGTLKPTIANYDANKMTVAGTSSDVNAGTYTLTYTLKDKVNTTWQDGTVADVILQWEITRKKLTAAQSTFSQSGTLTYNGSAQTPTISGYSSTYHDLGSETSATSAGTHKITITPKSNYAFSDGSTAAKTCNWVIGKKPLDKPSASVVSFEYDGSTKTLSVANYNSNYMTQGGTVSSSAKGNYTATYTLNDTSNYMWRDSTAGVVNIDWVISAKAIAKPTRSDSEVFTYDGTAKTITVSGYDSNTMTFSGSISEVNAGNYTATYALKDAANCTWEGGGTSNVVISWNIARAKLSAELSDPSQFSLVQDTFEFIFTETYGSTSAAQNYKWNCWGEWFYPEVKGLNTTYHKLGGTSSGYKPGTYTLTVVPQNNYCWEDGTTSGINFKWYIIAKKFAKPVMTTTTYTYTGQTITPEITPDYPKKTGTVKDNVVYDSGTRSATNAGTYSITYRIKPKPEYETWEDGTSDDITLDWEITVNNGIVKPTLTTSSVEWSGGNVSPTIANYDSSLMSKSGTDTAVALGTYSITFSLKDKVNTKWTSGDTNDVTLQWQVTRKKLTAAQSTFSQSGTLTYNGSAQDVSIAGYNSTYHDLSSQTSMTNAGSYTAKVTPKDTYCWSDGTFAAKSVSWSIQPLRLTKPTLTNTSYTYDTNEHSPTINNFNPTYEDYSGSDTAINASTYTLDFTLKNTTNTTWSDSSTGKISLNWVINKATTTLILSTSSVTLNNNASTATVTATYTGDGALSAVSNDSNIATATTSGKVITIKAENYDNTTISANLAAGTNYESATATISVTSEFYPSDLNKCSFATIQRAAQEGKASSLWNEGDRKIIYLNGTCMGVKFNNVRAAIMILAFDHNYLVEGNYTIHFALTGPDQFTSVYFKDECYHHKGEVMASTADYQYSHIDQLLNDTSSGFINILPEELQAVMRTTKKYFATGTTRVSKNVKMWIPSQGEFMGSTFERLEDYVEIYSYFASGNNLPTSWFYIENQNGSANTFVGTGSSFDTTVWTRDAVRNVNEHPLTGYEGMTRYYFLTVYTNNDPEITYISSAEPSADKPIIPCFAIG